MCLLADVRRHCTRSARALALLKSVIHSISIHKNKKIGQIFEGSVGDYLCVFFWDVSPSPTRDRKQKKR